MAVNTWAKGNIGGSSKTGASGSESSGGGGSGDFSIAKVAFVNSGASDTMYSVLQLPHLQNGNMIIGSIDVDGGKSVTVEVPTYVNGFPYDMANVYNLNMEVMPTIGDNLRLDTETGLLYIDGDGSITMAGMQKS